MNIKNQIFHSLVCVSILGSASYCSAGEIVEDGLAKVYDAVDKDYSTIKLPEGTSKLSSIQESDLRATIRAVRDDTKLTKVIIVSWSDENLPVSETEFLDTKDKELASERAENILKIVEELGVNDVEVFNMAEQPGWFDNTFQTDESMIKQAYKGSSVEDRKFALYGETLKKEGGPSSVVVLIDRES